MDPARLSAHDHRLGPNPRALGRHAGAQEVLQFRVSDFFPRLGALWPGDDDDADHFFSNHRGHRSRHGLRQWSCDHFQRLRQGGEGKGVGDHLHGLSSRLYFGSFAGRFSHRFAGLALDLFCQSSGGPLGSRDGLESDRGDGREEDPIQPRSGRHDDAFSCRGRPDSGVAASDEIRSGYFYRGTLFLVAAFLGPICLC